MDENSYKSVPVKASEITPEHIYYSRRDFLKTMGIVGSGVLLTACGVASTSSSNQSSPSPAGSSSHSSPSPASTSSPTSSNPVDELGDPANTFDEITHYNNYYEFTEDKGGVAVLSKNFKPTKGKGLGPWDLEVYGLVNKPMTFNLEDILNKFPQEERIYRLRCVEAWSMVIPWTGFPLSKLLAMVEPQSDAKYVRFESVYDPDQMPGQHSPFYPWPYQEGLRMDEAMHDLTFLVTGLYGKELPAPNGMPLRLTMPWKYGFKGLKSIVRIELVKDQPSTEWATIAPNEYGFYANVNPQVSHPRWSQASERRIGESGRRPTLMFNGYAEQVADLYKGMDLKQNY